jgi:alpha-L-arabinofuranosidase
MKQIITALILALVVTLTPVLKLRAQQLGKPISGDLFGIFFEDLSYAVDGGLYGELVQNRSFEYNISDLNPHIKPNETWEPFTGWGYTDRPDGIGTVSLETNQPIHENNPHYVRLNIESPGSEGAGLINYGYDGIVVEAGEHYNFSVFIRQNSEQAMPIHVMLHGPDGLVIGEANFETDSKDWKKYSTTISASQSTNKASLKLLVKAKGELFIDMISLFPQNTFKNRPNGLRRDLAQTIADLQPKFMRFPGGCLVHGNGVGNIYNWKHTIGPVEQRKGQPNIWGYYQSLGLGFFEYFQFCEDMGAKPLPVLAAGVSCQNSGHTRGTGQACIPLDQMPDYIQDFLDLIEYANGPVTSEWGEKRALAGHPEPFNLEYIGVGNEDKITEGFKERFKMINDAVKALYPDIKVVGTSGPHPDGEDFDEGWRFAKELDISLVDEHYYRSPEWFLDNLKRYDGYDRSGPKVYIGEYASWGNSMSNALSEAVYLTSLERNGDVVSLASYAPLLAKNDHVHWKVDLIFFGNDVVCPTVNYYVQQLFMANQGNVYHENIALTNDSTTFSSCVTESESGDIIVKLVNIGDASEKIDIDLTRFGRIQTMARLTVYSSSPDMVNSVTDSDDSIKPVSLDYKASEKMSYEAPAHSVSVMRINTRE